MGIIYGYCDLPTLKADLDIHNAAQDAALERLIEGASRFLDDECHHRFYALTETRYYTAESAKKVTIDDCLSITTLKTDSNADRTYATTWLSTDYQLDPANNALKSLPFWLVRTTPKGAQLFSKALDRGVQILGSFGFNATGAHPTQITEACLRLASRLFKRKDVPLGIVGMPEGGTALWIKVMDPDVRAIVEHFRGVSVG